MQAAVNTEAVFSPGKVARVVAVVLLAHIAFALVFRLEIPDFSRKNIPDVTIELGPSPRAGVVGTQAQQAIPESRQVQPAPKVPPAPKTPVPPPEKAPPLAPTQQAAPVQPTPASETAPQASAAMPVQQGIQGKPGDSRAEIDGAQTVDADYKAAYLNNPKPPYPRMAVRLRIEGTVILLVQVLPDGKAGEVRVTQSSGNGLLDDSALKTVKTWRFTPARKDGVITTAFVRVPIMFSLGTGASSIR